MYISSNKVSGLIRFIFETLIFNDTATIRLQVYTFGVESFTDGWIREQCNLTSQFPNVFVQGLNLAIRTAQRLLSGWSIPGENLKKKSFFFSY